MSKETIVNVNSCRLCSQSDLIPIIDFGEVPLGNNLQSSLHLAKNVNKYRLSVNQCVNCNHFQLSDSISPNLLYATNYTYLSGIGKSFVEHINKYVDWVICKTNIKTNNLIVDIGSNDGTCLKAFKNHGFKVCGVDPAKIPSEIANQNKIFTINKFFSVNVVNEIVERFGQADFITSQNVLAHISNPKKIFKNIYNLLKNDGYFAFEVGYFRDVLEKGCFDTIYHEHLDYHHAKPLSIFLTKMGFEIIEFSTNNIQGGSLRVLLKKSNNPKISEKAKKFIIDESNSFLFDKVFLKNWASMINSNMKLLKKTIDQSISEGKSIIAYGSPTKIVLLLKIANLNFNHIKFVVEDNNEKVGKYLPISGIEIKNINDLTEDYEGDILITAWNFSEDIIDKLKNKFKNKINVIIPLPNLKIQKI